MLQTINIKDIEININTYICNICGNKIRIEEECGNIINNENNGILRVNISSNTSCIHAEFEDICKSCSKNKLEELKIIIKKMRFKLKWGD